MSEKPPTLDPRGIGFAYCQKLREHGEKIAQCDAVTKKEQTYGELLQRCFDAALGMEKHGLKSGDFISICSLNHFDVCVPYLASLFYGAITASVDPIMTASEIVHLLSQVEPKIIFVGLEAVDLISEVVKQLVTEPLIVVFGESNKYLSFSKFLVPSDGFDPRQPSSLNETALVVFSSGTTGFPKGICHSHKSLLAVIEISFFYTESLVYSEQFTISWFTNPNWITCYACLHECIVRGGRRLVFSAFNENDPWEVFKFKIDFVMVNTTQALSFLKHKKPDYVDDGNVRIFALCGSLISVEQISELRQILPKVIFNNIYGQSELFGLIFINPFFPESREMIRKYPNCVGILRNDIIWKIVDIETEKILGPNQLGELRVKADFQCKGYHNRDSSETFDSEGYLKTGDLVYYNEGMGLFILNRIKESFKYLYHHIIPTEIERVLLTHPSVEKAVVFGVPHDMNTNHPMAVVEVKKKDDSVSEEEIVKYVEERVVDKNRLRAGVKIVEKIPLTGTDKVNRFKLREIVLHNLM